MSPEYLVINCRFWDGTSDYYDRLITLAEDYIDGPKSPRLQGSTTISFIKFTSITSIMPQMINYGGELIRISPKDSKKLEYSKNNGLSWNVRYGGSGNYGKFIDLMDNGKEILSTTEKGLFYSTNKGLSWNVRKRG